MTTAPLQSTTATPGQTQESDSNSNSNSNNNSDSEGKDNTAQAVRFIAEKLVLSFDEQSASTLFHFYALTPETAKLEPADIRKLLFDILAASEWPLVVPDESLDAVLHELCLNDRCSISWIEFKSFFVFLQDRPLTKLFQIATKSFTKEQLVFARLISITPSAEIENPNHDRQPWNQAISDLVPEATNIFIYFLSGGSLLALVIGSFDGVLENPVQANICMNEKEQYIAQMSPFNACSDVFPPIARSGGMKSRVARTLADSYVSTVNWDNQNFQIGQKTSKLAKKASAKWQQIDEKYGVKEKVTNTAGSFVAAVKSFDEKHQITRRVSATAKDIDTKYKLSEKASSAASKITNTDTYQKMSSKVNSTVKTTIQTVTDISQETQQLVQEQTQDTQPEQGDEDNEDNENANENVAEAQANAESEQLVATAGDNNSNNNSNSNSNNENNNESAAVPQPQQAQAQEPNNIENVQQL